MIRRFIANSGCEQWNLQQLVAWLPWSTAEPDLVSVAIAIGDLT